MALAVLPVTSLPQSRLQRNTQQSDALFSSSTNDRSFVPLQVIIPPKNIVDDLQESANMEKVLGDVRYRVGWEKHMKQVRDKEEAEVEKERIAYSSIDWHDFVVVQTVDFQPSETCTSL